MIQLPDFPENSFIYKAVYDNDDLYLDEDGKHIVFRNIRGRVVPVHVDSSDYVDWLREQGIPIDNTSQENMAQAEQLLDYLDRIREVAGPETAAKYEDQIVEKYKEYYQQASQMGYQQALEKRAQSKGMTAEDLSAQYKQTYEQNKGNVVKASKDREGEWAAFISEYSQRMLSNSANQDVSSNEWGVVHAFDLALMSALDRAKKGEAPSTVNLSDLVKEEIKSREVSTRLFNSRYDPKTSTDDTGVAAISLVDGLEALAYNIDIASPFGKSLEATFDRMYVRMFNDFDKPSQKNLSPMAGNMLPQDNFQIPDELPESFGAEEANRLVGLYKAQNGSKLTAAHKVMLHTLGRLWDQIPQEKRVQAFNELNDEEKGIHKLHKLNFIRAFQDTSKGLREYNPDRVVEEVLRDALHVKDSQNYNEIVSAIKAISIQMAHLDGYYAYKSNDKGTPSQKDIIQLWNNTPVLAGRARSRGEGPNLMQFFSDDGARAGVVFPNSILKVIHSGVPKKQSLQQQVNPAFNEQSNPGVPEVSTPKDTPEQPDNSLTGWRQDNKRFIDDSTGTEVSMTPIKLPSGVTALKLSIRTKDGTVHEVENPLLNKGKSKEQVLREIVGIVRSTGMKSGQAPQASSPTPKAPSKLPETPLPRSTPQGLSGGEEATKLHQSILKTALEAGSQIRSVINNVYSVTHPKDSQRYFKVAIDKEGRVVVSVKEGSKWVTHYVSTPEEAAGLMRLGEAGSLINETSNPEDAGVQTEIAIKALGDISPGDANNIKNVLAHASQLGLSYRALTSTGTVRIMNKNNPEKGYVSVSNREGVVKAHLILPDGNIQEIPLDRLGQETSKLL